MMKTVLLFLILINFSLRAQIDIPVYSDYLSDNYYLLHPSMAGASSCAKLRFTARKQWFELHNAPSLQTLSLHSPIGATPSFGVGGILFNDKNGNRSIKGVRASYAHHLLFSRSTIDLHRLSFGITAGMSQVQVNETGLGTTDDPIIYGAIQRASYYNIDVGASYYFLDFYAHATVKNTFDSTSGLSKIMEVSNFRKFIINSGVVLGDQNKVYYEPSFMFQVGTLNKEKIVDINIKAYKTVLHGNFWGALSYRSRFDRSVFYKNAQITSARLQYATAIIGVNYNKLLFAYTFSHIFGGISYNNGGLHQLTLGIDFGCRRSKYDCKCPSVH